MAPLGLTRRDVLAAFLGAPVAAACARRPPPRPPGEIVGASDGFGHRLRDEPPPRAPSFDPRRVVIVGGGVAGLAAGWRLLRDGFDDFVLCELEDAPGGTARAGDAYPWGAHYVPAPQRENRALCALLDEMDILDGVDADGEPRVAEQHLVRDPEERVYYRGRWYEGQYLHAGASAEDERQLAAFLAEIQRWVDFRDGKGRRAFTLPTAHASDDADITALDRETFRDWAGRRRFNSPRLLWLLDYACRDDYGCSLDETSAWAGVFYFAARATRSAAETRPLMTWPRGNGHLVAHLWSKLAGRASLGEAACDVAPGDDGIDVTLRSRADAVRGLRAERVIWAAPQLVARRVIRGHAGGGFQYGAWMVANLHLRDRPHGRGFPLAWDNVLYDSPSLGYVVATHQRGPEYGPTVFTYYFPLLGDDARARLLAAGQPEWADVALADLARAHPDLPALTQRLDVMRWGHAMVRPRPGFRWGTDRAAAERPFRNVHFACSDLSGVALFEEAFDHGVRAAEEVLASLGRPVESLR